MSTVECYDLHVYCDVEDCNYGTGGPHAYGPGFGQFAGRNQREAYQAARRAGWILNKKREGKLHGGTYARCPEHA